MNDREKTETKGNDKLKISITDEGKTVLLEEPGVSSHKFHFDKIFNPDTAQEAVYEAVGRPVVTDVLNGFNGTIFTYGQTGSGKTFTMMGPDGSLFNDVARGVTPRAVQQIFASIPKSAGNEQGGLVTVRCSYLQIYMEKVHDLLVADDNPPPLKVRETPSRGVWVDGISEEFVSDDQDVYDLLLLGGEHRRVSTTNMNKVSSRSHAVFIMTVEQKDPSGETNTGKLNLVDLAGSEKVSKTEASGQTFEEAKKINLSLSTLSNCIHALTTTTKGKPVHIPFRESQLTHILKDSLVGNSKTTLVITCSPSQYNLLETIGTMQFGERAKTIHTKPKQNKLLSAEQLIKIVEKLTAELAALKKHCAQLEKLVEFMRSPNYKPGMELPIKLQPMKAVLDAAEATASAADDDNDVDPAKVEYSTVSPPSAATELLEFEALKVELQKEKERNQIVQEDLKESAEFLRKAEAESRLGMEAAKKRVAELEQTLAQKQREAEAERQKVALAIRKQEYQLQQDKCQLEALTATVQQLGAKAAEAPAALRRAQELETALASARAKADTAVASAQKDVDNVCKELDASEERNAKLEKTVKELTDALNRAESEAVRLAEQAQSATRKFEVRVEENNALRAGSKLSVPKAVDECIGRVEKQLDISAKEHLAAMQKLMQEKNVAITTLQQQLDRTKQQAAAAVAAQKSAVAAAAVAGAAGTVATPPAASPQLQAKLDQLEAELRSSQGRLNEETASRALAETQIRQVAEQKKQITELESMLEAATAESIAQKERLVTCDQEVATARDELERTKERVDELTRENERLLLRPSNKMFRPANWRGCLIEAYEQRLNFAELPGMLRQTNSAFLHTAKQEALRSATPRGELAASSSPTTVPASTPSPLQQTQTQQQPMPTRGTSHSPPPNGHASPTSARVRAASGGTVGRK
eukprot:TRINITY_DN5430_c0_g1_i2.p1 TRINITY_DN5430_c0_g1~~TRINITY_DN5430_c0_g1_i2.p1  ORF type:complete len:987 (-),score=297.86 TRINITY_DN5430_c0_g1_i2:53-2845(-)